MCSEIVCMLRSQVKAEASEPFGVHSHRYGQREREKYIKKHCTKEVHGYYGE